MTLRAFFFKRNFHLTMEKILKPLVEKHNKNRLDVDYNCLLLIFEVNRILFNLYKEIVRGTHHENQIHPSTPTNKRTTDTVMAILLHENAHLYQENHLTFI